MYFVDRIKIDETLKYTDLLLTIFENNTFETMVDQLGLERLTHVLIESVMDVGNMMIDGFIMRDPGSYDDIIDILIDEKVLPKSDEKAYKTLIALRTDLVREYIKIDHSDIYETLKTNAFIYTQFSSHITTYLDNELGVANAFSNEPEARRDK